MILTTKQEEGLKIAVARYKNNEKYTCIAGYAGTGKSTLIKYIIAALDVDPDKDVCYVAFTGKAATVLKQKGCANAITAHKLLYYARPMPDGTYRFERKKSLDYRIVVVDEVSMLPADMWQLLLSHQAYIIATGDPGQLPPIEKENDNHVLDNPHVFLDEVMRQAKDSEIIRLSMWIREGKSVNTFPCNKEQVQIFSPNEVVSGMYNWADQILCATNNKRNLINNFIREQKGYGPEPDIGDKIIGLHNHWDCFSTSGDWVLTNGTIGTITDFYKEDFYIPRYICENPITLMFTSMKIDDEDNFGNLPIDYKALTTGTPALNGRQSYLLAKWNKNPNNIKKYIDPPYDFAYAYAITTWKAQGSEWEKVLGCEEDFPFDKDTHKRFLYTMATRASKKLVIITKN